MSIRGLWHGDVAIKLLNTDDADDNEVCVMLILKPNINIQKKTLFAVHFSPQSFS